MNLQRIQCNLEWGVEGALRAGQRREIGLIIDCLSFSTAVVTAVAQGAVIYPCGHATDSVTLANTANAELAVKRQDVPKLGRFSLSPPTLLEAERGSRIVLPSLNGGSCVEAAIGSPFILTGALINAKAAAGGVVMLMKKTGKSVTIVACGEQEESADGVMELRHAEEDYLSAGAILAELDFQKSTEADKCEKNFIANKEMIAETIWNSPSALWLRERGFGSDVEFATELNKYSCLPFLTEGRFEAIDLSTC